MNRGCKIVSQKLGLLGSLISQSNKIQLISQLKFIEENRLELREEAIFKTKGVVDYFKPTTP